MEGLVLMMVVFAPWFYGAVDPVFEYVLFLGIGLICLLWGVCSVIAGKFVWFSCPVALALGGLFLIGAVQLVPLPDWALSVVSPTAAGLRAELLPSQPEVIAEGEPPVAQLGWPTVSVYPTATRQLLMRLLAMFILFAAVRVNIASTDSLKRLAWVAMINGVLLALFGIWQFVHTRSVQGLTPRSVFGFETRSDVFGPFICRNHFAYYANVCIGLTIGLLLIGSRSESDKRARRTYKAQALEEQDAEALPTLSILGILHSPMQLWLSVAISVIIAGLVCSMSRGGVAAIVAGVIIAFCLRGFRGKRVHRLELAVVPILLLVGFVAWLGVKPLETRLNPFVSDAASDGRLEIWQNLMPLAWRFPVLGAGYGALQYIEPLHRQRDYTGYNASVFIDHAHNDYLEAWVEGGVLRFALTVAIVYYLFRFGRKAMTRHEIRTPGRMAFGALVGISAVAVHSFVDFGLFTPACAVIATVTAAQLCSMARTDPSQPPTDKSKHSIVVELAGWGGVAALAVFVMLAVLLTGFGSRQARVQGNRVQAYQALHRLKNPDLAAAKLRAAVQLSPDDADLRTELGQVYLDAQRASLPVPTEAKKAEPVIDEPVKLGLREMIAARNLCPLIAKPHARLAAYAADIDPSKPHLANSDPAAKYWQRAVQLAPYDAELLFFAGQYALQQGNNDLAWDLWRKSLERSPKRLESIVVTALPYLGGEGMMAKILPNEAGQLIDVAKMLADHPKEKAAQRKLLVQAKGLLGDGGNAADARRMAQCCWMMGEVETTRSYYRQALEADEKQYVWRTEYAQFLDSLGTESARRDALQEIRKVIDQSPHFAPAVHLYNKLIRDLNIRD